MPRNPPPRQPQGPSLSLSRHASGWKMLFKKVVRFCKREGFPLFGRSLDEEIQNRSLIAF